MLLEAAVRGPVSPVAGVMIRDWDRSWLQTWPGVNFGCRTYTVHGQLFFASADAFVREFNFKEVLGKVIIDVTHAHFWDLTAVASLDKVVLKFRREGTEVEILGLNEASATLVDRLGVHDKPDALERLLAH